MIPGFEKNSAEAVVLGASVGAVEALSQLLPPLPASTPFPILVVVHVPATRPSLLAELFKPRCALVVHEPFDKEPIGKGIWFAPPDYHMLVAEDRSFALSTDPPVHHSRPSIDVLFESAAEVYGDGLVAIVLSGASEDGAAGAARVRAAGGRVVAQDPKTAEGSTMPSAAIRDASPQFVGPLPDVARLLLQLAGADHT